MDALLRLLALVERELEADDAHVRLGGAPDSDPRVLEHELRPGSRLVVRFSEPPAAPERVTARLAELARAFVGTVDEAIQAIDTDAARPTDAHALVDVLADLREATGAAVALVVDQQSPVIWGSSEPSLELRDRPTARGHARWLEDLHRRGKDPIREASATETPEPDAPAELEQTRRALQQAERAGPGGAARLVAAVQTLDRLDRDPDGAARQPHGHEAGLATKQFGGLYVVVLAFTRSFSPLRVEGVLRRALPIIERIVLELPPLDPQPKGGRVVPLHRD